MDEVYMTPQYRRKKLGKQLVDELISWFHQQDVSSVHVYVDVENEPALHFWVGIGLNRAFYILSKH
ncbi:GNAT family N-acetyltransferase [Bacillus swezeyi]|uniref:GNAT family N-acetyltransferase n=1 Tax=Bacillus swezeyi TaxID=1925020 RepID=UPI0039C6C35E